MAQEDEWTTPEEDRARARRLRAKQKRGKTLTREEAGFLGAQASMETTRKERKEAQASGREEQFERAHQVETWTNAPESARTPHLSDEDARRAERLRGKKEAGRTLSREEAGFLGGVARVGDAERRSD